MHQQPALWDTLHESLYADCKIFKIYKKQCKHSKDGRQSEFYVGKCNDWVQALALTKTKEIILINQFRVGSESLSWETPGGILNGDESPEVGAARELLEETGYMGKCNSYLGFSYPNPAIQNNKIHFVLIEDCEYTGQRYMDPMEDIQVFSLPIEEAFNMLDEAKISHALTINALFFLKKYIQTNPSCFL